VAEREGFEPPIPVKVWLISSQLHSTGLCHLSAFRARACSYGSNLPSAPQRVNLSCRRRCLVVVPSRPVRALSSMHPFARRPCYHRAMQPVSPAMETVPSAQSDRRSSPPRSAAASAAAAPVAPVASVHESGYWGPWLDLGRYLMQSEVHTYAFSVAANAILAIFPFIVLMFTIARRVFHSPSMVDVIGNMVHYFLPANQDFVVRNMSLLVHPHGGVQVASFITLLISSSGVFLPLEVALNRVWGIPHNRSYLLNQLVSFGLALGVGLLALVSIGVTALQSKVLTLVFFGHTQNIVFAFLAHSFLQLIAALFSVAIFFLIYWLLPNRKLPFRAVLPTAIVIGLSWELAKILYVFALRWMNLGEVYGPFAVSVSLMMWAFLTGLLLLAGAHVSATRYTRALLRKAQLEEA
jgi:membrane protein